MQQSGDGRGFVCAQETPAPVWDSPQGQQSAMAMAKSGDIVGEIRVRGTASFSSRFGGGTCRLPVSLKMATAS